MLPAVLLLTSGIAATPILVSRFEIPPPGNEALGRQLVKAVLTELSKQPDLELVTPVPTVLVKGRPSDQFIARCPVADLMACTFDVGRALSASWAIMGQVRSVAFVPPPAGSKSSSRRLRSEVVVTILDISTIAEAAEQTIWYQQGEEAAFGRSVADLLIRTMRGESEPGSAALTAKEETLTPDDEEERNLDELDENLDIVSGTTSIRDEASEGEPESVEEHEARLAMQAARKGEKESEKARRIQAEKAREEQLRQAAIREKKIREEGRPAVDARSRKVEAQRARIRKAQARKEAVQWPGRRGQGLIRLVGGGTYGLVDETYFARYTLPRVGATEAVDMFAWQDLEQGFGGRIGLELGFGLLKNLELYGAISWMGGTYTAEITEEIIPDQVHMKAGGPSLNTLLDTRIGGRFLPFDTRRDELRPVFGVGVAWRHGSAISSHEDLPLGSLPWFPPPDRLGPFVSLGLEVPLSPSMDLAFDLPFTGFILGDEIQMMDWKGGELDGKSYPATVSPFEVGLNVALQWKLPGE